MVATPGVVVGVNDTTGSTLALRWAADEAQLRRLPLHLTHAYRWPPFAAPAMYAISPLEYQTQATRHAEAVIASARALVRDTHPELEITSEVTAGDPAAVLVDNSTSAATVVVGSRRLGAVAGTVLGSVGLTLAARARCPVVVLRGSPSTEQDNHVVVGVDTTDVSEAALAFAFDHAERRHLLLRAVLCWTAPFDSSEQRSDPVVSETTERHRAALNDAVTPWSRRYPEVRVDCQSLRGHPTDTLVEQSLNANLLVVGARGRHPLVDTLLGSVSQGVLHHATCPVAVLHD